MAALLARARATLLAVPEALVRRRYFSAMRQAAVHLWGSDGLAAIGRALPEDVRKLTVDLPVVPEEWVPATSAMAWFVAVWDAGAANATRDSKQFSAFVDRQTEVGFGKVRSFLLSHATPAVVLTRAPKLWRDDNSAGEIVTTIERDTRASLELRDHIYATTPLSRLAITELVRTILARCRKTKEVRGRSALSAEGALQMSFAWENG